MKEKGVLLAIFSLPSKYGIGDFGYEACEFIDILSENGVTYWEILPINACNRLPYSPISYYALNEDYISLDRLKDDGLILAPTEIQCSDRVVYEDFKLKYCKEAYSNFKEDLGFKKFIRNTEIKKYAYYMSEKNNEEQGYYLFIQYMLYKQWMKIKEYANLKEVQIIGDMPSYPNFDSAETKYNYKYFEMDGEKFTYEAGTPPDYYNSDGQKWNCPVYNVEKIKKDNYEYFINRYKYYFKLFDKIRIDYFRGYESFYKIPIGKKGKDGFYQKGVGYDFFNELFKDKKIRKENLIIEDLGDINEETVALRDFYRFTRQKVLQFTINLNDMYDEDNDSENVVVFPANHDCSTMYGWYKNLNEQEKTNLKEFLRRNECYDININIGIMQYCMKCKARIAIVMVQDILGLDDSTRINVPGVDNEKNWSWKLQNFIDLKEQIKYFS